MVLLCNDNPLNIKDTYMLKCLEKRKNNFKVVNVPLKENNIETDIIKFNEHMNTLIDKYTLRTSYSRKK